MGHKAARRRFLRRKTSYSTFPPVFHVMQMDGLARSLCTGPPSGPLSRSLGTFSGLCSLGSAAAPHRPAANFPLLGSDPLCVIGPYVIGPYCGDSFGQMGRRGDNTTLRHGTQDRTNFALLLALSRRNSCTAGSDASGAPSAAGAKP